MRAWPAAVFASALCLTSFWPGWAAEGLLRGRVLDAADGTPLPGATVVVLGAEFGAHTDAEGRFRLQGLPSGRVDLSVSFVGYRAQTLKGVDTGAEVEVRLKASAIDLPDVVVSATRRVQSFSEAPISISVADARQIAEHNAFTLSGPLRYVSGVSQIGSQVNIRGSSGFSRGTGSRVLLLMDGFPMLAADLGDFKWDSIPVTEVERVEVIKGAGSALYGTGALGGVINVITRDPESEPQTRFRLLSGLYSQPAHAQWRWTDRAMYLAGVDLSHSRTLGRSGLILAAGHKRTRGYEENDEFRRYHLYAKAVHRFSNTSHWRLAAGWAVDDHGVFVQWKDRSQPLAVPESDRGASTVSWKLNLHSELYRLHRSDLGLRLRTSYYRTGFENTRQAGGLRSDGHKLNGEFQADYSGWQGLDLVAGTSGTLDLVRSPGDFLGRRQVLNLALFAQGVYALRENAEAVLGLRYDWNRRGGAGDAATGGACPPLAGEGRGSQGQFSPQVGFSWRPRQGTALRASAGRGFRAPSVSELHTQAAVSGLLACPNPLLQAERSASFEVGAQQWFGERAAVDMALFWNRYEGLIEGRPDAGGGSVPLVRFRNLSRARVRGLEIEARAALFAGLRAQLAYTLLDAVEFLAEDEILPPYCREGLEPGGRAPLPYRSRHALNAGLEALRGESRAGVTFQFASRFARISGLFPECRRDHLPVYLVDFFAGRRLGNVEVNLRLDNALHYHYVLSEREIRPPRQWTLGIEGQF